MYICIYVLESSRRYISSMSFACVVVLLLRRRFGPFCDDMLLCRGFGPFWAHLESRPTEASFQPKLRFNVSFTSAETSSTEASLQRTYFQRIRFNGEGVSTDPSLQQKPYLNEIDVSTSAAEAKCRRRKGCSESFNSTEISQQRSLSCTGQCGALSGKLRWPLGGYGDLGLWKLWCPGALGSLGLGALEALEASRPWRL